MLLQELELEINELHSPELSEKNISVAVARLDKIHPVVSGNKLYKLHYFLEASLREDRKQIVTFGGAYSNHLVATAFACGKAGIPCTGVVRGERPDVLSHTLKDCEKYGMQLHFISRETYALKDDADFPDQLKSLFGEHILVPEGGYHPLGAKGASQIMEQVTKTAPTHVCTAVGTATTLAGLLLNNPDKIEIIGVPVLKNLHDIYDRLNYLGCSSLNRLTVMDEYHFGGYAKQTPGLISFMNNFFSSHSIPLDFVYTAKMMYAVMESIRSGHFTDGSRIICLHTGGLQGNVSLPPGTLVFN